MKTKYIWECPSNIALVKYWGKRGRQIPMNSSVSMTLSAAVTRVELTLYPKTRSGVELEYAFEGKSNAGFLARIQKYIEDNLQEFGVAKDFALHIESQNSFPHSTGIASSASAFGALALALLEASGQAGSTPDFFRKASHLARLGSGSACRSVYGPYALWGETEGVERSSNEYAISLPPVHPHFADMGDAILIVDDEPKKVSSTAGHALMNDHVYAASRFTQANDHCRKILEILTNGNYEEFITIVEQEALTLHAMMMTSQQSYLLLKPGTIYAIERLTDWRKQTNIPACFTLDAGPNVHLLYPRRYEADVRSFIDVELKENLKDVLFDRTGVGPNNLTS